MRERVPEIAKTELDEAATMTSSSFVEEPAPRAHRQCRRRSPPTGWSSGDLIPKGTPPPPLDAVTGNRTRGPSPPCTTPTTPRSCRSRGRHHRLQRRPHPQKPHPREPAPPHPQAPWRSPARRGAVPTASCRRGRRAEKLRRGKRSGHLATAEEEQKKRPPRHCNRREPKQTRSASAAEGAGATQPADESFSGHLGLPTT